MFHPDSPRVVYCGMFGTLSRLPLDAILRAGCDVRAVVVPPRSAAGPAGAARELVPPPGWGAEPVSFAALRGQTIVDFAWGRGIPILEVGRFDAAAIGATARYEPDLICVSCFPTLFPPALLALPPRGVLNLHPTLLPRGRGPDPLFWAFRARDPERAGAGGVTIHLMDRGLDSGPIVAQGRLDVTDGMREAELELRAAALGGDLLARAARDLAAGGARPQPQDEALATTYPPPGAEDFIITPDGSARWAFNCIRGTAGRGVPHRLRVGDREWLVRAAVGYDPDGDLDAPFAEAGATVRVRCDPGTLTVTTAPPP